MRPSLLLGMTAVVVLLGSACGGGASDPSALVASAEEAMTSGEYAEALDKLERAIEALRAEGGSDDLLARARLHRVRCRIHTDQGTAAAEEFRALASELGERVTWKDYKRVGESLSDAEFDEAAVEILDSGKKKFPDRGEDFDAVIAGIMTKDDLSSGASEKLKELGYIK